MRHIVNLFPLAAMAVLAACGGGGSGAGEAPLVADVMTVEIPGDRAITGHWYADSTPVGPGGIGGGSLLVGDFKGVGIRGYLGFDIQSVPADAEIVSAEVSVYLVPGPAAGLPFTKLGDMIVDYVDYGIVLEAQDYANTAVLQENIGTLASVLEEGVRSLDVTQQLEDARLVAAAPNGRPKVQFRLRFLQEDSGDLQMDAIFINGLDDLFEVGVVPTLRVQYRQ